MRQRHPMLRPEHFPRSHTKLGPSGLCLSELVDATDRVDACLAIGETFGDTDRYLGSLASRRPAPTRIVANPYRPSAETLRRLLKAAQAERRKRESISVGYGLPKRYDRKWKRIVTEHDDSEGQGVVLVAFQQSSAVGYCGINVALHHDADDKVVTLRFELPLIYVAPQHRGKGYGIDLSIAGGWLCRDLLEATYNAVPAGSEVRTTVSADYESEGGEDFTTHLVGCLEYGVDMLGEYGRRRSVQLMAVDLNAGY